MPVPPENVMSVRIRSGILILLTTFIPALAARAADAPSFRNSVQPILASATVKPEKVDHPQVQQDRG